MVIFKITAGADGIKTTNEEDSTEGYIIIKMVFVI